MDMPNESHYAAKATLIYGKYNDEQKYIYPI